MTATDGWVVWDATLRSAYRGRVYASEATARTVLSGIVWHARPQYEVRAISVLGAPAPAEATDTQGLDDARAAYFNARTCQCGEDARRHRCPTDEGRGFDPDWERVREMLERCQATERSEP